jgi:thiopurine S-methyltransferase
VRPRFWHDRWRLGQIGFHQSVVDRNLERHWPHLGLANNSHVFVPLCGKSLDMLWLRERGHAVAGVELSSIALESFCLEHGVPAQRRALEKMDLYETGALRLFGGDFFALTPELLGPVAAVYDRAALISWAPELRRPYVEHLAGLTEPGTQTLLVTMEYPQAQMAGPPFSVSAAEVQQLYSQTHIIRELARHSILEIEPRLQARGLTELHEVSYHLTRW